MCLDQRIAVLKFGGSVLQSDSDLDRAAQEIYRWRRNGFQVVAIVSAIGNTTDRLSELASNYGTGDACTNAQLLATGEIQCVALLGLALNRAGIPCLTCDEVGAGIIVDGDMLNATPRDLDTPRLRDSLDQHGTIVVPGYVGRDSSGQVCLLGRGGSDLSALFIAKQLNADVCRLLKDVPGLYEYDPKCSATPPRRFESITYSNALLLDDSIVQHKGIRFARDNQLCFEVAELFANRCTRVGPFAASEFAEPTQLRPRLRVAILGFGTVGQGVFERLHGLWHDRFDVVCVAVRNYQRALSAGVPARLLTTGVDQAIYSDCDVVIELIGGDRLPRGWIESALKSGKHVVTANKTVLAESAGDLQSLAAMHGVTLAWSAAVGGSAPVLETIEDLTDSGQQIVSVAGVVNGSTNYILEHVFEGNGFDASVAAAKSAGLTESDPARDLAGIDAAEKLVLIVEKLGYELSLDQICREQLDSDRIETGGQTGCRFRQMVRWSSDHQLCRPRVTVERVDPDCPFAGVFGSQNLLRLETSLGKVIWVHGEGAGRWPTTSAVVADLLDIELRRFANTDDTEPLPMPQSIDSESRWSAAKSHQPRAIAN